MISKCTVLMLAEDSHLYRKLERVLEHEGCRVLRDAAQVEAIHIRQIDLILAQVNLEDGEELAVLKQVKRLHPQVRVVLCSRDGETAFPVEAYQLEVDDYLFMPCRRAELWRRVAACLKRTPGKSSDLAAASWFTPINGEILEKLKRVFHYIRYNLDSATTALQPLINTPESRLDKKSIAKICEASARLEVLQEMTDGFLRRISGVEAVTFLMPKKTMDGFPCTTVNRLWMNHDSFLFPLVTCACWKLRNMPFSHLIIQTKTNNGIISHLFFNSTLLCQNC